MPTIRNEHPVSSLGVQISHFIPERSQTVCKSVTNFNFECSLSKMVTKGKVAKVRLGRKAHGKIHGFKTSNGMPACNQADNTPYVMACVDDLLVSRTPLPMGLHCWAPLRPGAGKARDLLTLAISVTPCMLSGDTPGLEETINLTTQQM